MGAAAVVEKSCGQYHEGDGKNKVHASNNLTVVLKDGSTVAATHKLEVYAKKQRHSRGCLAPFRHLRILHGRAAFLLPMSQHTRGRPVFTTCSPPSVLLRLLHHPTIFVSSPPLPSPPPLSASQSTSTLSRSILSIQPVGVKDPSCSPCLLGGTPHGGAAPTTSSHPSRLRTSAHLFLLGWLSSNASSACQVQRDNQCPCSPVPACYYAYPGININKTTEEKTMQMQHKSHSCNNHTMRGWIELLLILDTHFPPDRFILWDTTQNTEAS